MREPDFHTDGWCLEDGEEFHRRAPDTFQIPPNEITQSLQLGDFAKLIFRIAVAGETDAWERMWVIDRERIGHGYLGVLDNDPDSIAENDLLWSGTELPFEARHIVDAMPSNAESRAAALAKPRRGWS